MQEVFDILYKIKNTTSRNEKMKILTTNYNNQLLKDILYFVYNPFIITGIANKKLNKLKIVGIDSFITDIYQLMDYLKTFNSGKDENIKMTLGFIQSQPQEQREWYRQIVTKNMKIGITASTINKIWKNFIHEFKCQLASPYNGESFNTVLLEPKLDGYRAIVFIGGDIKIFTRTGKLLEGFNELKDQLKLLPKGYVLDGELIASDFTGTQEVAFKKTDNKDDVNYYVFDVLPLEEFEKQKCSQSLWKRKIFLTDFLNGVKLKNIINVPYIKLEKDEQWQIDDLHKRFVKEGFEGTMIKDANSKYEYKRTKTWLKMKDFDLVDLEVIDVYEGAGKYKNMLGGVTVDYKGYELDVGTGWTDEQRLYYWENPNDIIGKIISVQAQEESKDKNGNLSLRFPVVKLIRKDK